MRGKLSHSVCFYCSEGIIIMIFILREKSILVKYVNGVRKSYK